MLVDEMNWNEILVNLFAKINFVFFWVVFTLLHYLIAALNMHMLCAYCDIKKKKKMRWDVRLREKHLPSDIVSVFPVKPFFVWFGSESESEIVLLLLMLCVGVCVTRRRSNL